MSNFNLEIYNYENLSDAEKYIADDDMEKINEFDINFFDKRDTEIAAVYNKINILNFFIDNNVPISPMINILLILCSSTDFFYFDFEAYDNFCKSDLILEQKKILALKTIKKDKFPSVDISFNVLISYFGFNNTKKSPNKNIFHTIYEKYSWQEWQNILSTYNPQEAIFGNKNILVLMELFAENKHKIYISPTLMTKIFKKSLYDIFELKFFTLPPTFFSLSHRDKYFTKLLIHHGTLPVPLRNF